MRLFGYAADSMAAIITRKGARIAGTPIGFFVSDSEGPLKEGELDRAAAWAATLMEKS